MKVNVTDEVILKELCNNDVNGITVITIANLAKYLKVSRNHIKNIIDDLRKKGFVELREQQVLTKCKKPVVIYGYTLTMKARNTKMYEYAIKNSNSIFDLLKEKVI